MGVRFGQVVRRTGSPLPDAPLRVEAEALRAASGDPLQAHAARKMDTDRPRPPRRRAVTELSAAVLAPPPDVTVRIQGEVGPEPRRDAGETHASRNVDLDRYRGVRRRSVSEFAPSTESPSPGDPVRRQPHRGEALCADPDEGTTRLGTPDR